MEPTPKAPIIIGVLLVICAVFYYFYTASNSPTSPDSSLTVTTSSSQGGGSNDLVGSNVVGLLSEIQQLNIDTTFFQTPIYQSLTDFNVTIPTEPVGKGNPFSPLPGLSVPAQTITPATHH